MRVRTNRRDVERRNRKLVAQEMPFAIAKALTDTAGDIKKNTEKRIVRVFDRPNAFTKKAVFVRKATKTRLRATVGIKDRQVKYLQIQEEGGTRYPQRRAIVLPARARTNRYGNIPRGAVRRAGERADTFSGRVGSVAGMWRRMANGSLRLLYAYEDHAKYKPSFGFQDAAHKTANKRLSENLRRAIRVAIRTSR